MVWPSYPLPSGTNHSLGRPSRLVVARFPGHSELVADAFRESRLRDHSSERRTKEKLPRKEITLEEFIQTLGDSGLMSADEVRAFVDDLPADRKPTEASELAR